MHRLRLFSAGVNIVKSAASFAGPKLSKVRSAGGGLGLNLWWVRNRLGPESQGQVKRIAVTVHGTCQVDYGNAATPFSTFEDTRNLSQRNAAAQYQPTCASVLSSSRWVKQVFGPLQTRLGHTAFDRLESWRNWVRKTTGKREAAALDGGGSWIRQIVRRSDGYLRG
jgi:hypothetical protein